MPPRHGKSELISRYFPAWYLGTFPDRKIILVSYEQSFAATWGRKTKELLEEHGGELFDIQLNKNSKAAFRWDVENHDGGLTATGIGGSITGKGANVLIVDDPVKNDQQANSKTFRDRAGDWFKSTALTRLEPDGACIVVMTRWHYDDLVGRLLEDEEDEWEVIDFPAIATDDDVLGRKVGEPLWPNRFNLNNLNEIKQRIGSYWFTALYQQQPIASEFQIFKTEWWRYYDERPTASMVIQVYDTAYKQGQENDYTVCATWGIVGTDFYLLDLTRGKYLYPELKRMVSNNATLWNPTVVLIEDAASGQSLIQDLRYSTGLPVRPIKPIGKELRANIVSPLIEDGRVYLPSKASWLKDFMSEHSNFPNDSHDDIVDTTTMALEYLSKFAKVGNYSGARSSNREKKRSNRFSNY